MSRLIWLGRYGRRLVDNGRIYRSVATPLKRYLQTGLKTDRPMLPRSGDSRLAQIKFPSSPLTQLLRNLASNHPGDGMELNMPALSPTMETGAISVWLKQEGDKVSAGDSIATVETDKSTLDWEVTDSGYIAKILYPAGSKDIPVGTLVAIMVSDEKDVALYKDYQPDTSTPQASPKASPKEEPVDESKPQVAADSSSLPDHTIIEFPALSPTMDRGTLGSWAKKEGDLIKEGETLCTIDTDKSTNDFELYDQGYIAKILVKEGTADLPVGSPIAVLVSDEAAIAAFKDFTAAMATKKAAKPKPSSPPAHDEPETPQPASPDPRPQKTAQTQSGDRIVASPYAKKIASEANVSLEGVAGTGPGGRIVASDVQDLISRGVAVSPGAPSTRPTTPFTDIEMSQIRRVIAARLTESKQTIPHYYLTIDCVVDELIELRKKLNSKLEAEGKGVKLSINDFVVKAAALALRNVPEVNSSWQGEFIRQYNTADICVAVQTPVGLMVPVVRSADSIGLQDISSQVKSLAEKAKNLKLKPDESSGGTFTISNLGMFGIKEFSAIINPPQAAILAVGSTHARLAKDSVSNEVTERNVMTCTLSCDHRVVDGAVGALWLKEFKAYLEQPLMMLL